MAGNPIQYTSRTYTTVMNDINNESLLKDTPEWWKRKVAGSHHVLSVYQNAIANNSFLRTAFTRQAVMDLCALIDYQLSEKTTSSGTLLFYLNPDTVAFPKTLTLANLIARTIGSLSVSSKRFEARAEVIASATSETFTADDATDLLTVAREYATGEKVRVSTTVTLPDPLAVDTDYYVIKVSATTIKLASSINNSFAGTAIDLTDTGTGTHTITLYSVQVTSYQQETASQYIIGKSDGSTSWQKFDLQYVDVIKDTLYLTINGDTWTRVDSLLNYDGTAKVFLLKYNTDNSSYVEFGNGTYGAIPGNFDIYADHAYGGGSLSNVSFTNKIIVYGGSDTDVTGVTNATTFTGGDDEESLENAKEVAPILLKTRDRFVTVIDGEALALGYGGIAKVKVNKNVYGIPSAQVPIVPSGGGLPSAALKSALQTYLIDRTILEVIDVRVIDPTYVNFTPVAAFKVLTGYTFANVKPFVMLAFRLLSSEKAEEIYSDYLQNGIASAVVLINSTWSTSFTVADYVQIEALLQKATYNYFGQTFQESDFQGFIDSYVIGLDYITISSPSFPVTLDGDEISTDNVLTGNITEIT